MNVSALFFLSVDVLKGAPDLIRIEIFFEFEIVLLLFLLFIDEELLFIVLLLFKEIVESFFIKLY